MGSHTWGLRHWPNCLPLVIHTQSTKHFSRTPPKTHSNHSPSLGTTKTSRPTTTENLKKLTTSELLTHENDDKETKVVRDNVARAGAFMFRFWFTTQQALRLFI